MTGIYIFKNTKDKKCYIGQSSDLERRRYEHYHPRKREKDEFHLDLRENPENFEYEILQECLVKELNDLERLWVGWYKNERWKLYNRSKGGECTIRGENHPMYGKHHSEDTKQKISEAQKGNQYKKGKKASEETKKKIGAARKGKPCSEETKKKISKNNARYWTGKIRHWRINPGTGKREYY